MLDSICQRVKTSCETLVCLLLICIQYNSHPICKAFLSECSATCTSSLPNFPKSHFNLGNKVLDVEKQS